MKPTELTFFDCTLVSLNDHMCNVVDWISHMYPAGYIIVQYRSNLNSTLNKEFRRRIGYFKNCQRVDEVKKELDRVIEVKYPIHVRRIANKKPPLRSNEEA